MMYVYQCSCGDQLSAPAAIDSPPNIQCSRCRGMMYFNSILSLNAWRQFGTLPLLEFAPPLIRHEELPKNSIWQLMYRGNLPPTIHRPTPQAAAAGTGAAAAAAGQVANATVPNSAPTTCITLINGRPCGKPAKKIAINGFMTRCHACYQRNFRHGIDDLLEQPTQAHRRARSSGGDNQPGEYKCPQCDQIFTNARQCSNHKYRTHSSANPVCSECHRTFSNLETLTRHMHIHVNDINLECEYCGRIFNRMDNLTRHYRVMHGETS